MDQTRLVIISYADPIYFRIHFLCSNLVAPPDTKISSVTNLSDNCMVSFVLEPFWSQKFDGSYDNQVKKCLCGDDIAIFLRVGQYIYMKPGSFPREPLVYLNLFGLEATLCW